MFEQVKNAARTTGLVQQEGVFLQFQLLLSGFIIQNACHLR